MERTQQLAKRLEEVLLNGTWIANTNFKEQLTKVHLNEATRKLGNHNTIASLTFHVNYYLEGLIKVFRGGPLDISDQYSFDMPELNSAQDWEQLVSSFLQNAASFTEAVANMPEALLDEVFVHERYGTYLRNIEGVIEHGYYHLGQIVLLQKLLESKDN